MGAAAEYRGNALIRQQLEDERHKSVSVRASYLSDMALAVSRAEDKAQVTRMQAKNTGRELERAKRLISRLRSENAALKEERAKMVEVAQATKQHKWCNRDIQVKKGVVLVSSKLKDAQLI